MRRRSRHRARPKARPVMTPRSPPTTDSEPEIPILVPPPQRERRRSEDQSNDVPLPCKIVKQLKYSCCFLFNHGIGDSEMELLAEVFKTNDIVNEINLGSNKIGDAGVLALFYPLRSDTRVTTLRLHKNLIGDAGASILAEAMKTNTAISELYLGSNRVGDIGTEAIAQTLNGNQTLRKISLVKNLIGDTGVEALSEALKINTSLTELCLDFNLITERGLQALTIADSTNKTLHTITLKGNQVEKDKEDKETQPPEIVQTQRVKDSEYTIDLRSSDIPLGVDFQILGGALLIDAIHEGLVSDWNRQSPEETLVEIGDRVIEVNGIRKHADELMRECKEAQDLSILLKRRDLTALALSPGHRVFVEGFRDRQEVNGQRGIAIKWHDPVKRWKVKLEDGSVIMCRPEELKIDMEQVLAGGYKVGDLVLSRVSYAFRSGAELHVGDEGMVVAPGGDPPGIEGDLRLCVAFDMVRVVMLATGIMPIAAQLSPAEYQIIFDTPSQGLGLSLETSRDGTILSISSITSGGLIEEWNTRCEPDSTVRIGDHIVEVNGFRGAARLLVAECKRNPILTLVLMRSHCPQL